MKIINGIFLVSIIAGLLLLSVSCQIQETGTVTINMTDAPIDTSDISEVNITITGIAYHTTTPDEWVEEMFSEPKIFDLLALTGGISKMLGQFTLPAGQISQLRFYLDAPVTGEGTPSNPGCSVVLSDETVVPLFVPSGETSGFKATGAFVVPVNDEIIITADFDARKSITKTSDSYNLRPTIRLIAENEAGDIKGTITYAGTNTLIIFAYEDGTYNTNEADNAFSNAVTSAAVEDAGGYILPFLAKGTYDLVLAEFDADGVYNPGSAQVTQDVDVNSEKTTIKNIEF